MVVELTKEQIDQLLKVLTYNRLPSTCLAVRARGRWYDRCGVTPYQVYKIVEELEKTAG